MKKTLTGIALLLLLVAGSWLARNPILMGLANLYLKPSAVTFQCMDFDVDSLNKLAVHKLCLSLPQADITLQQANWDLSEKSLNIDSVTIIHQQQRSASSDQLTQPLKWQIPDLPVININNIQLSSPLLKAPVNLSLQYRQPQLRLTGPVMLEAKLENNLLSGTLKWRPTDLAALVKLPVSPEQRLNDSTIQTRWTFDGQSLQSQHQLSVRGSVNLAISDSKPCPLEFELNGTLGVSANILSQQALVDLSALPAELSTDDCPSFLPEYLAAWQPKSLKIVLPEPAKLDPKGISIPQIRIHSVSPMASLALTDITSDFNRISATYQLNTDNQSAYIEGTGNLDVENIGALNAASLASNISFVANNHHLRLNQLQYEDIMLQDIQAQLNASYSPAEGLNTGISVTVGALRQSILEAKTLQLRLSLTSADLKHIQGSINASAGSLSMYSMQVQDLKHQSHISHNGNLLILEGKSGVKTVVLQGVKLKQPKLTHHVRLTLPHSQPTMVEGLTSTHTLTLASGFYAELTQQQQQLDVKIPAQPMKLLNTPIQTRFPQLIVGEGQVSGTLNHQADTQRTEVSVEIGDVDLAYGEYLAQQVNLKLDARRDSGQLHISPTTLSINTLQTGVGIHDIKAQLATDKGQIIVNNMQGHLFDGQFHMDQLTVTDAQQSSLLTLSNLDMARILELQQETGIDLQGRVSGNIPVHIHNRQVEIRNGSLFNLNQGKLKITDNAAFSALKQNQPQLEPVLSLLQNLQFTELNSDVSMQPDGLLFLDMQIKGRNPDEKQDVNFNYTHEENIFTLLRALRLGEEIQDKLEQRIK